jgi:hypothetical protein
MKFKMSAPNQCQTAVLTPQPLAILLINIGIIVSHVDWCMIKAAVRYALKYVIKTTTSGIHAKALSFVIAELRFEQILVN